MIEKVIDKLFKDMKAQNRKLDFYESLLELSLTDPDNVDTNIDLIKESVLYYREEVRKTRDGLLKLKLNTTKSTKVKK